MCGPARRVLSYRKGKYFYFVSTSLFLSNKKSVPCQSWHRDGYLPRYHPSSRYPRALSCITRIHVISYFSAAVITILPYRQISNMQLRCEIQFLSSLKRTSSVSSSLSGSRYKYLLCTILAFHFLLGYILTRRRKKCKNFFLNDSVLSLPLIHPMFLIDIIDFRTDQKNIHTKIHPQHQQGNGGQTPIHGKSVEIIHINGEPKGKHGPGKGAKYTSRQLAS